jgi:hypothetical protein
MGAASTCSGQGAPPGRGGGGGSLRRRLTGGSGWAEVGSRVNPRSFDWGAPCCLPLLLLVVSRPVSVVDHPYAVASFCAAGHGRRSLGEADVVGCRRVAWGLSSLA